MRRCGTNFISSDDNGGDEPFVARNSGPPDGTEGSRSRTGNKPQTLCTCRFEGELESGTSHREDGCIYFKYARLVCVSWK
jgi:hypothetical protein